MKMCLNWKVLVGLAGVAVAVVAFAPGLLSAALPLLVLAACPLSMLLMMVGMNRTGGMSGEQCATQPRSMHVVPESREERLAQLRRELNEIGEHQGAILAQIQALEVAETRHPTPGDHRPVERDLVPVSRDERGLPKA